MSGNAINVAVVGTGFVGRGLVHQLALTPGMRPSLLVSRRPESGIQALVDSGYERTDVVVSDDPAILTAAIDDLRPAVTSAPWIMASVDAIDVVVEATGDVEHGAVVALMVLDAGKHLVSLNYETDATVGPLLAQIADQRGLVYTGSDGDQPGVMMRLIEYVEAIGLDVVAAVNCKGFLDVHATPKTIRSWAERQGTSLKMTTAFTDGTKMNVENCSVANAAGLISASRGMTGIETTLSKALDDFGAALTETGVVEYTLGGDFGSGVFVIGSGAHPDLAAPYLEYLKMGPGPWYLFFRPWHLVHFETPLSIAEAVLDGQPTIAPMGAPVAQVVTLAKRALSMGDVLGGIGTADHYGEIDRLQDSRDLLPVGLAEGALMTRFVEQDEPLTLDDIELNEDQPIVKLWRAQHEMFRGEQAHMDQSLLDGIIAEYSQGPVAR